MIDKEKYIIYDYKDRSDVVSDAVFDALSYVFSKSYPKPEKTFKEICTDIKKSADENGHHNDVNYRITYCDGKYTWPYDFYYIPNNILKYIWDNRQQAANVKEEWRENINRLIEFFYEKPGLKDVYSPTKWSNGENVRHCEDMPLIKDIIGEDAATKLKDVLESYRDTYKWGLREVNQFGWGFLATPTSNRQTVIDAWKTAFNKDIEIPDDSHWVDTYEMNDLEWNDEENSINEETKD